MAEPPSGAQNTTFPSNGGQAHGYLALPPEGRGPGLVVVQEWWGLTTHMTSMVDRFAAEGFVTLAPDLYGGATTHDREEAARLLQELPAGRAVRDLRGAVDFLLGHPALLGTRSRWSASAWAAASRSGWPRRRATRWRPWSRSTGCRANPTTTTGG